MKIYKTATEADRGTQAAAIRPVFSQRASDHRSSPAVGRSHVMSTCRQAEVDCCAKRLPLKINHDICVKTTCQNGQPGN